MKVMKICLRCATMMKWTTWNLDPLLICSTTQMKLVCFAENLGETRSYGSDVASVLVWYMLNVAQLKRRIILCVTYVKEVKKRSRNSDNFLMAYDILFHISVTHVRFFRVRTYDSYLDILNYEWIKLCFVGILEERHYPSLCAVLPHGVGNATQWHCLEF
jgi:hypothetical protein